MKTIRAYVRQPGGDWQALRIPREDGFLEACARLGVAPIEDVTVNCHTPRGNPLAGIALWGDEEALLRRPRAPLNLMLYGRHSVGADGAGWVPLFGTLILTGGVAPDGWQSSATAEMLKRIRQQTREPTDEERDWATHYFPRWTFR